MTTVTDDHHRWVFAVGTIGLLALTAGCELPEFPSTEDEDPVEWEDDFQLNGNPEAGAEFYSAQCASCHGQEGQGDGAAAQQLRPPATDFTAVDLEPQRAYHVIRDGGQAFGMSPAMPAFRQADDDQQIRDVTAYILQFAEDEPTEQQPDDQSQQTEEPDAQDRDNVDADESAGPDQSDEATDETRN